MSFYYFYAMWLVIQLAQNARSFALPVYDGTSVISAPVTSDEFRDYIPAKQEQNSDGNESGLKISLLPTHGETSESVNLEVEGIPSKVLSSYDNSQNKIAKFTNPKPILDTISEHEKYGNSGDKFDGIARSIVNGYEAFSNLLNTLIEKPKELTRSISKGITSQLDIIGGKIVGL